MCVVKFFEGSAREAPRIYVAGPFRADSPWEVECNIRKAERVGLAIAKRGAVPVIPHTMYRFFEGVCSDVFWLGAGLNLLSTCNAIMMCDKWRLSKGSLVEHQIATEELFIPCFDSSLDGSWMDFETWLRMWG